MLSPTKEDVIQGKFLSLEAWAHRGRESLFDESKRRKAIQHCQSIIRELNILINTSEQKGKELGWWS